MNPRAVTVLSLALVVPATTMAQRIPLQNLLNNPESVVYDQSRCRYLVSNWGDGNIIAIDSLGIQTYFNTEMRRSCSTTSHRMAPSTCTSRTATRTGYTVSNSAT